MNGHGMAMQCHRTAQDQVVGNALNFKALPSPLTSLDELLAWPLPWHGPLQPSMLLKYLLTKSRLSSLAR